jgi:hypothetical protein
MNHHRRRVEWAPIPTVASLRRIAWLIIAWLVLRLKETSVTTVGVLLGVVFIIAGVNEVGFASLVSGGWKVWHYVTAFISSSAVCGV